MLDRLVGVSCVVFVVTATLVMIADTINNHPSAAGMLLASCFIPTGCYAVASVIRDRLV